MISALHDLFKQVPEAALFLSLAIGYSIGRITIGRFSLGGVGGSLIAAVVISQVGVDIQPQVQTVLFTLFIYAVGYDSGPQFFNALNRTAIREIAMALFLSATGLAIVIGCARLFHLDKGMAAGIASGGLTQSAIIGTAGDAIRKLQLPEAEIRRMQSNVAIGYAVTYIFGSLGAIIICVSTLPRFMRRNIREDALEAERALAGGRLDLGPEQTLALPDLVGRLYHVTSAAPASGATLANIEGRIGHGLTIERVRRGDRNLTAKPDLRLAEDDDVLVVGLRGAIIDASKLLGDEVSLSDGMNAIMERKKVVLTARGANNKTLDELRTAIGEKTRHGVYLAGVTRMGKPIPSQPNTVLNHGDVLELYGAPADVDRVATLAGYVVVPSDKTDFIYLGLGVVLGSILGLVTVPLFGVPVSLGTGGGALVLGLIFGWLRAKRPTFGALPSAASQILKDIGLAGFVAAVGLASGAEALHTIRQSGFKIFLLGVVVTVVPLLLTMAFGRYVLHYRNVALFAGALAGSRSANPAFGEVLEKAGNSVPTVPFAITYAIANVLLTMLGPLIVAMV